jgi:hypothetical protein
MRFVRKSSEKEIICSECGSILYYEAKDTHLVGDMEGEYSYCIKCPECDNYIKV